MYPFHIAQLFGPPGAGSHFGQAALDRIQVNVPRRAAELIENPHISVEPAALLPESHGPIRILSRIGAMTVTAARNVPWLD